MRVHLLLCAALIVVGCRAPSLPGEERLWRALGTHAAALEPAQREALHAHLAALSGSDPDAREAAFAAVVSLGPGVARELEPLRATTRDAELLFRLDQLQAHYWAALPGPSIYGYDLRHDEVRREVYPGGGALEVGPSGRDVGGRMLLTVCGYAPSGQERFRFDTFGNRSVALTGTDLLIVTYNEVRRCSGPTSVLWTCYLESLQKITEEHVPVRGMVPAGFERSTVYPGPEVAVVVRELEMHAHRVVDVALVRLRDGALLEHHSFDNGRPLP